MQTFITETEEHELIRQAQSGSEVAKTKILVNYRFIIDRTLCKLYHFKADDGAKRYGAILGLMSAIKGYDFRGNFVGYATWCAFRRAERELAQEGIVKIPMYLISEYIKQNKELNESNWPTKTVTFNPLYHTDISSCRDEILHNEIVQLLEDCFNELKPIERESLQRKFGYLNETLQELGEKHGLTRERIRQIGENSLLKLKRILKTKIHNIEELK